MITPPLNPIASSESRCGFCPDAAMNDPCNEPATWHIAWKPDADGDLDCAFACDPHMAVVQRLYVYLDRHPVGDDCAGPDAHWVYGDPSTCMNPVTTHREDS